MRFLAIILLGAAVLSALDAVAENRWEDLVYGQFGDRYGHIEAMARTPNDRLYLFVSRLNQDTSGYDPVVMVRDKGGCWQEPVFVMGDSGQRVRTAEVLVSPATGTVYLCFTAYSQWDWWVPLYLATQSDSGWEITVLEEQVHFSDYRDYSDAAIDSLGRLHAVWERRLTVNPHPLEVELVYAHNLDGPWSQQTLFSGPPGWSLKSPQISVTPEGRAVIAYIGYHAGFKVYTMINDCAGGENWQIDSVDLLDASQWGPKSIAELRMDREGTVHMIFTGVLCPIECDPYWIYYVRRGATDSTWTHWDMLTDIGELPQLEIDEDLNLSVLYHFVSGYNYTWVIGYSYFDGSSWTGDTLIDPTWPTNLPDDFAFTIDSQGYPHLVYDGYYGLYAYGHIPYEDFTIGDVVYLIKYIFNEGAEPCDLAEFDVDCSGFLNVSDAVYMINYIWGGGDPPCTVS